MDVGASAGSMRQRRGQGMSATLTSVDRARQYVAKIPGAVSGQGGHNQTFSVACYLFNGFGLSESDALALILEYNQRCSPPWSERELRHKVKSAAAASHDKPRGHLLGRELMVQQNRYAPHKAARPKVDPATAVERWLKGFSCDEVDLWEASPIRPPEDWCQDGLALVSHLYRSRELVNFVTKFALGKDGKARPDGGGQTVERDALVARWKKDGMPISAAGGWLRMNPMDGRGVADANVTALRFMLVEADDEIPSQLQLPLLVKLELPIAAILTSAGRSLHAWVQVDANEAEEYAAIVGKVLGLLSRFGIDGKNKNPSRLSRLPGVVRTIGAEGNGKQRLLYLNPDPHQKAIL
jgi:hypothetical protein